MRSDLRHGSPSRATPSRHDAAWPVFWRLDSVLELVRQGDDPLDRELARANSVSCTKIDSIVHGNRSPTAYSKVLSFVLVRASRR